MARTEDCSPLLEVSHLCAAHGAMQVLWNVRLRVAEGSITALLGPNGAGKSSLLATIMGRTRTIAGGVKFAGEEITRLSSHQIVERGLNLVPEGKHLFRDMTVRENLQMGGFPRRARRQESATFEKVCEIFPRLGERLEQKAGSLSGGEQQMLTLSRSLMTQPRLLMLDEPSQGLSPKVTGEMFQTIGRLRRELGLTILLIDQNAIATLALADEAFVMKEGAIELHGPAAEVAANAEIRAAYLGL